MIKYQQIAAEIETYIEENALVQGDKLPVLEALMTHFNVSKSTVTKALELLEKKGAVFQVRGSGIFVRRQKRKGYMDLLSHQGSENITSKVIELEVKKPTKEAAHHVNVEPDEDVYYVKRVRYRNGQALCLEESYFNKSIVTYLNKEIVSESIFDYIQKGLGVKVGFSDVYLHAGKLKREEAKHLCLENGAPSLYVESIFHVTNGQPFAFSTVTYHFEQSHFFVQTNSPFS
ncbi:GntR family transcriptional regulator [Domibacillus robiginosus]|uniref:GntR family transcriptional regulator n=1 Tax=Domibacillus robiginosus TaxID=1071054 RepID=UPI00067CA7A8|nr:GntR family transcriptional regulator [Domibacillus robiginosus]